jgi:hypothetical protein
MSALLDQLEAESEARRLLASYARAADRLDRALLESIFHPDATISLGTIYQGGVSGFLDVCIGFMGAMTATRHDLGQQFVRFDHAGSASVETYVQAWHRIDAAEGTRELTVYGRYLTRIERRDGRWAIAWHSELIDWGREVPANPAWFDGNTEMDKGRRDGSDASARLFQESPA